MKQVYRRTLVGDASGSRSDNMKRLFWPLLLGIGGALIGLGGFAYAVTYAGIPHQDPTPELHPSYALHSRIAFTIIGFGVLVFLAGWVAGIRRYLPLLPVIGGGLLAVGGFGSAAAFAGRPELAVFVRIARIGNMLGWCGVGVFLFGVVAVVVRRRKST